MIRTGIQRTLPLVIALLVTSSVVHAQTVLTRHVRSAVLRGEAAIVGRMPANQTMDLDVVLPLRGPAGLKSFLADVYNPHSVNFHHYLTPGQFTRRFGPTQEDYDKVVSYLRSNGFTVVGGSRDGMEVQVKGSVTTVETAFHVNMGVYQHPTEGRTFYGPDREPVLDLDIPLWHISGLDNFSNPRPLYEKKEDFAARHGIYPDAVVKHATTGSGPSASFLGSDMRAAYYGSGSATGAGQTVGLWEYYGTDLADVTTYYKNVGQTNNVPITLLSTDGTSTSCTEASGKCDDTEQTLDITQALGMAPGLSGLVVFVGSTDTAIIASMTTHTPLAATIGCSWGWTPADPTTLDPYFQKMAAQGQNFFAASGDNSTWTKTGNSAAWPADDANVVSVGGTDLVTASAGGAWSSETAWVDSGGGISPDGVAIPAWQKLSGVITSANKGSATLRNGPDVSANANFTFYVCADQTTCTANSYGGTSFAAPMWAGYIALVNQQLVAAGKPTIGFLNPTLYAENVTSTYATDFHDVTSGTSGSYSATTGYDLVTGWGSPTPALVSTLVTAGSVSGFTLSASPSSLTVVPGSAGTSSISSLVTGGFNSAVTLTASGLPTGVTASFSAGSITGNGSSTLTLTVASTTATGTYPITITGTSGSTVSTTTVNLTVSAVTAGFSVSVSPTTKTVTHNTSSTVTVSTAVTGGFASAISLTATGQGSGTTLSFSPTSITGAGSSTLTIKAARTATKGTYTITIKGTSGSTSHTATLTLTIN